MTWFALDIDIASHRIAGPASAKVRLPVDCQLDAFEVARYRYHFHIDTIDDLTVTVRTSPYLESHLDIIRLITMTSNTTNKMKAVVYRGPNHVEVVDKDIPTPGPGEVVVRVTSSGLW